MASILSAGTFLGALVAVCPFFSSLLNAILLTFNGHQGDVANVLSCRPTIIIDCVIFTISCILKLAPQDVLVCFDIGCLVTGAGIGFISAIIILYMSKIAPKVCALLSCYCTFT
jgi:hypothetical protein